MNLLLALGRRLIANDKLRASLLKAIRAGLMGGAPTVVATLEHFGVPTGWVTHAIASVSFGIGFVFEMLDVSAVDDQVQQAYVRGFREGAAGKEKS